MHRIAANLLVGRVDALAQRHVVRNVDGFAKSEIFVVRSEDRDGSVATNEERLLTGQLALADELPHGVRQVENLESLFHFRRAPAGRYGTRNRGRDDEARSQSSPSG